MIEAQFSTNYFVINLQNHHDFTSHSVLFKFCHLFLQYNFVFAICAIVEPGHEQLRYPGADRLLPHPRHALRHHPPLPPLSDIVSPHISN